MNDMPGGLGDLVRELGEDLIVVDEHADPLLGISSIFREHASSGRVVLFNNAGTGSITKRVVMNLWGTRERIAGALGCKPDEITEWLGKAMEAPLDHITMDTPQELEVSGAVKRPSDHGPRYAAPFQQNRVEGDDIDLFQLPVPKYFPGDGGPYITAGVIFVDTPGGGLNASFHRMMLFEKAPGTGPAIEPRRSMAVRLVERHLFGVLADALRAGQDEVKVSIAIGLDPVVMLPAAMSVARGVDEMRFASALSVMAGRGPLRMVHSAHGYPSVPIDAEIVIEARLVGKAGVGHKMVSEGPFVDITGTLDPPRMQPYLVADRLFYRDDAIFHALYPSGAEHFLMMGLPREPAMKAAVAKVARVGDVTLTRGGSMWLHGVISIHKKGKDDGVKAGMAALEGHRSMKSVVVVDEDIDVFDPEQVEWAVATRMQPHRDIHIIRDRKGSSLDPSAEGGLTSKMVVDATMPLENKAPFKRVV